MNKEYYKINTNYASYYVELWHSDSLRFSSSWHQYPNIDKIYIGGRKKCVSFSVYLEEKDSPNLDSFGYNPYIYQPHLLSFCQRSSLIIFINYVKQHI